MLENTFVDNSVIFLFLFFKWMLDQIVKEKQPKIVQHTLKIFQYGSKKHPRMYLIKLDDKIKVSFLLFFVQCFDR